MVVSQITVGLVEPVDLYRDLIASCIDDQSSLKVEFAVRSADEIDRVCISCVDVLLVSLYLAHTLVTPATIVAGWQDRVSGARLVLISDSRARRAITSFLRCGVRGYLIRNTLRSVELLQAVHVVADGSIMLSSEAQEIVLAPETSLVTFTPRELDIIRVLPSLRAKSRPLVAKELGMSVQNLNNRISNITIKLNVAGIQGIIDKCFDLGIIPNEQSGPPNTGDASSLKRSLSLSAGHHDTESEDRQVVACATTERSVEV